MALTAAEEAQTRELLAQQAAILSLADSEPEILSNLGATDVSLSDLTAASTINDDDLLLIRQGSTDKSISGVLVKSAAATIYASTTEKGIVELATSAETQAGTDTVRAVTPAGLASAYSSIVGSFSNLKASATGTNATVTVTADEIVVESSSNAYKTLRAVSLSIAGTSVGANGLDAGALAISTWYSVWAIWNGTTTAGLLSLSSTSPTMPSGYTHKARIGWVRTDGTANKYPLGFKQYGRNVQYIVAAGSNVPATPIMASGVAGSNTVPTYVAVGVSSFVPPTASRIKLTYSATSNLGGSVAPNSSYGAGFSQTNPPYHFTGTAGGGAVAIDMMLESSSIYWSSTGAALAANGWEDNI